MDFKELPVPFDPKSPITYLSQWPQLLDYLPSTGKFILNKELTGCGGTTLFLESELPLILVSPRSSMLFNKSEQDLALRFYLFRKRNESSKKPPFLKNRLGDYINRCKFGSLWNKIPKVPKILVTIDSYKYVAEQLDYMGCLKDFYVVVDEFQCVMSDSKYKGKTEIEFLHNLTGIKSVCYLSATPIPEDYLNVIPDFRDVDHYIRLKWNPSVIEKSNILAIPYNKETPVSICSKIISDFKTNGFFKTKKVNGIEVYSREVVIYLNEVKTVLEIIEANQLDPKDVNVICSLSHKLVPILKKKGIAVAEFNKDPNNPHNRTYTFVTRAGFEGVDFYSDNAFTYIFCDGVLEWNKHDMIIDVPQIMGRQRLASNPFRKDAILYYRTSSKNVNDEIENRVKEKIQDTDLWEVNYNRSNDEIKRILRREVANRDNKKRYQDNYIEFVDDFKGGYELKRNELVMYTELRDYELSNFVYSSPLYLIDTLANTGNINVSSQIQCIKGNGDQDIDNFNRVFHYAANFPDKMKAYLDLRYKRPDLTEWLYENAFVDSKFHQSYDILGPDKIRTLRFREKDIQQAVYNEMNRLLLQEECNKVFKRGHSYRLSDIKPELQRIYSSLGIVETAKASDLENILSVKSVQLTNKETGKRELYYQIL